MAYRDDDLPPEPGVSDWTAALNRAREGAVALLLLLLVLAGALIYLIAAGIFVQVQFGPALGRSTWPLWALLAAATAIGAGLVVAGASFRRIATVSPPASVSIADDGRAAFRRWLLALLIIGAMLLLLVWGVYARRIDPVAAALVLLCGSATVVTGLFAVESLSRGESPRFESHWGGLGGGTGGWRMSPNATLILLTLIFLAGAFAAAGLQPEEDGADNKVSDSKAVGKASDGGTAPAPRRSGTAAPQGVAPAASQPAPEGEAANSAAP